MAEYQATLKARAKVLGVYHADAPITRNHLALALENLGRIDEAGG
jgi:hypothetical protein